VAPVHELLDEIIGYLAFAFQHGQDTGPENLLKLLYLAPGKHIKGPALSEKAISNYGMKMRMKPGVISKGMNDHHKAWNSVWEAKHGTKEKAPMSWLPIIYLYSSIRASSPLDMLQYPLPYTEYSQKPLRR
jgi:hypothetical protein